jgi:hypothetical protein
VERKRVAVLAKSARFVVYVFGMALFGFIFASVLTNFSGPWNSIGKVPGTVTELFYVWPSIYVKTSNDLYYACDQQQKSCSPVAPNTVPEDSSEETYCYKPEINVSKAPGKVVASYATKVCHNHGYVELQIAALDDGSIWIQHNSWGAFLIIFQFLGLALGGFIGLVVGLHLFLRSHRNQAQEKHKR